MIDYINKFGILIVIIAILWTVSRKFLSQDMFERERIFDRSNAVTPEEFVLSEVPPVNKRYSSLALAFVFIILTIINAMGDKLTVYFQLSFVGSLFFLGMYFSSLTGISVEKDGICYKKAWLDKINEEQLLYSDIVEVRTSMLICVVMKDKNGRYWRIDGIGKIEIFDNIPEAPRDYVKHKRFSYLYDLAYEIQRRVDLVNHS